MKIMRLMLRELEDGGSLRPASKFALETAESVRATDGPTARLVVHIPSKADQGLELSLDLPGIGQCNCRK